MSHTEDTQEIAAAKAGMDVKTARKYLRIRRLPSETRVERYWKTPGWLWRGVARDCRTAEHQPRT